jgi:two-component system, cell cycle response regulator DivK
MANEIILLVEDNPKNPKLVRDVLQVRGHRTFEAGTGEKGVQLARDQQPALILMDIHLPGITGEKAFHQLRADPVTRAIPVIAVTASLMAHDQKRIMAAGFDGFRGRRLA